MSRGPGRRIVVDGCEYRWRFGSGGTLEVRRDGRTVLRKNVCQIHGIDWHEWERSKRKGAVWPVTPAHVERCIRDVRTDSREGGN